MKDVKELKDRELKQAAGGDDCEFAIPDVIGWYVEDAKREIDGLGFSCSVQYENSTKPKDTVVDTCPSPGFCIDPPFDVILFVSQGKY